MLEHWHVVSFGKSYNSLLLYFDYPFLGILESVRILFVNSGCSHHGLFSSSLVNEFVSLKEVFSGKVLFSEVSGLLFSRFSSRHGSLDELFNLFFVVCEVGLEDGVIDDSCSIELRVH